jgi:hypothetical protein
MLASVQRNPLIPWFIGVVIIILVDIYIFYSTSCEAPGLAQFLVLVAVPGIYLVLMYLTFRSQALSERH